MYKVLVLVSILAGCVVEEEPQEAAQAEEWRADVDDGFGYACTPTKEVVTPCLGTDGATGTCWGGVCRRTCASSTNGGCPPHQHWEFGPGGWQDPHSCVCIPNMHAWRYENLSPVPIAPGTGRSL